MDIVKSTKSKPGVAKSAIAWFAKLYAIEKKLKEDKASTTTVLSTRQQQSKPILDDFKLWL